MEKEGNGSPRGSKDAAAAPEEPALGQQDALETASEGGSSVGADYDVTEDGYRDAENEKTLGRRVATFLARFHWYYPIKDHEEAYQRAVSLRQKSPYQSAFSVEGEQTFGNSSGRPPSLDSAWAFFEHVVLPRYVESVQDGEDGSPNIDRRKTLRKTASRAALVNYLERDTYYRAEPGEYKRRTRLYPVWSTPEEQLADFGVGIGLYFNALKAMSVILLISGLICIPTILYYASTEYSPDSSMDRTFNPFEIALKGSAICSNARWVACPNCTESDWNAFPRAKDRLAFIEDSAGERLPFIMRNFCQVDFQAGLYLFVSLLFFAVAVYLYGHWSRVKEVTFDEAQQTTTDYSIEVMTPPTDARDVKEWKEFFSQFGHVTAVTIALDNEELLRTLVKRRQKYMHLQMMMPGATRLNRHNLKKQVEDIPPMGWSKWLYMSGMHLAFSPKSVYNAILRCEEGIEELSKKKYEVANVFATFETEEAQRRCLKELNVSHRNFKRNNLGALPENLRFRKKHVLDVNKPVEPDSVRWQDLEETVLVLMKQRFITYILTIICIVAGGGLVFLARSYSAWLAALVITALNSGTPYAIRLINTFESHSSEGSLQSSLYIKMTLLRWFYTAIVTAIITPFTDMIADTVSIDNGNTYLIDGIYAIFFAELIKNPVLQLADYTSNLKRHLFGPRILDSRFRQEMFAGAYWTLAERYTDATKVLFLACFYCTIFPAGLFFAAGTMVVHYWTDKYCILRCWKRAPTLAYDYGRFPFDHACETDDVVSNEYVVNNATALTLDGKTILVTIEDGDTVYDYCSQNLFSFSPPAFPPRAGHQPEDAQWMTDGQGRMLFILGWALVAIVAWLFLFYFVRLVLNPLRHYFFKTYRPKGKVSGIRFSRLPEPAGYVPNVRLAGSNFPALVCDTTGIEHLVGWKDPHHSYDKHNLIFDVPHVRQTVLKRRKANIEGDSASVNVDGDDTVDWLFSTVRYWPPPGRDGEAESGAIDGKRNHPTGGSENEDEGDVKGVIAKLAMED